MYKNLKFKQMFLRFWSAPQRKKKLYLDPPQYNSAVNFIKGALLFFYSQIYDFVNF